MAAISAEQVSYPPDLSPTESIQLVTTIKDWSIAHGLAVRPPVSLVTAEADPHGVLATTVPVTLFPSPFPRVCFEQARYTQKPYNDLYASIARDEEFLTSVAQEWVASFLHPESVWRHSTDI